jgi:hypothetical protein
MFSVCEGARSNEFGRGTQELPKLLVKTHQDQATKDSSGDLRRAATSGLSIINLNREKVKASVVIKRLRIFLSHLVRKSESAVAVQTAAVTYVSAGLKEAQADDTATQRLYSLRSQGNVNVQ